MVRLRIGRFAGELYYTGKAVLTWEERKRRVSQLCGHLGYFASVAEYLMTDLVLLRSLALGGAGLIVGYQAVQPKIQFVFVFWNSLLGFVNAYYLHDLIKTPRDLSEEEADLLKRLDGQLTLDEFRKVLQAGTWQDFEKGETLGQEASGTCLVCLIASGTCDFTLDGCSFGSLGPGSIVGEDGLFEHDAISAGKGSHPVPTPVAVAQSSMRCLCLQREQLKKDTQLMQAVQGVLAATVAAKVIALSGGLATSQHSAVQELAASARDMETATLLKEAANQHGLRHGVSTQEHHVAGRMEEPEVVVVTEPEAPPFHLQRGVSRSPSGVEHESE